MIQLLLQNDSHLAHQMNNQKCIVYAAMLLIKELDKHMVLISILFALVTNHLVQLMFSTTSSPVIVLKWLPLFARVVA